MDVLWKQLKVCDTRGSRWKCIGVLGNMRPPRPHGGRPTVKQVESEEEVGRKVEKQKEGHGAFYFSLAQVSKTDEFYQLMLQIEKILRPKDGTNTGFIHFPMSKMTLP